MKYDPRKRLNQHSTEWEVLMMPFSYEIKVEETNWEMVDMVIECIATLEEPDQRVLYEIFYDKNTYETLANNLGIKAKSHAWRKTQQAMDKLKKAILEHPSSGKFNNK